MKIGLLTYHHSSNNGAMLQAYATAKALKELGHEVQFIDLRQPEPHHSGLAKYIVNAVCYKRDIAVKNFKSHFYPPLTQHYLSVEELRANPPLVDCLVVGSDQVWNPDISKEMAMAYFLDFGNEDTKRFSYASSFGVNSWPSCDITPKVRKALDRFDYLSVRETTAVNILKETFGKDSIVVVDPTMLFRDYVELTGDVPEKNEVVCYKLNRTSEFFDNISAVKQLTGIPVRLLNNSYPIRGLRYTYPPSVEEWIRRIGGAQYVITDSFHGAVFSILYHRKFAVIKNNNGKDSRLLDLLKAVGLENRAYDSVKALQENRKWIDPIDYTIVLPKIEELRKTSWNYLKQALA